MAKRSRLVSAGLAILALVAVSCDTGGPTPPTPQSQAFVRLDVAAPPRIVPGESVQLTATLVKPDGSRENASDRVVWFSDSAQTLAVSQTGLARADVPGEAMVSASFQSFRVQARILVLPPGTFKLSGVVTGLGLGVGDVAVAVLSGTGEGLTVNTRSDGQYALFGVAGRVRIGISRHGYSNRVEEIDVTDHHTFSVQLEPDLSTTTGSWTLTLTAGPCDSGDRTLPAEARSRSYRAQVVEEPGAHGFSHGYLFRITLLDADFIIVNDVGNRIWGFRDQRDQVSIIFAPDNYGPYVYEIFERVGPDSALAIFGGLFTRKTASAIEGGFAGSFLLIRDPPNGPIEARCDSKAHFFRMRRQ